jgi:hypothetical protein
MRGLRHLDVRHTHLTAEALRPLARRGLTIQLAEKSAARP